MLAAVVWNGEQKNAARGALVKTRRYAFRAGAAMPGRFSS
jgi:hypothetical protein